MQSTEDFLRQGKHQVESTMEGTCVTDMHEAVNLAGDARPGLAVSAGYSEQ